MSTATPPTTTAARAALGTAPGAAPPASLSPLEQFVRDYVEARGGAWDEVEPQVYDLIVEDEVLRVAFDPEALPEHPQAQLASFGSPLIDRMLADAQRRGRFVRLHAIGLNLLPHDLQARLRRCVEVVQPAAAPAAAARHAPGARGGGGPAQPPALALEVARVRVMNFPQAVFWFEATFLSDQKEQEVLPVAMDLHYGRQVRHLEQLLAPGRLAESAPSLLPEARHDGLRSAYLAARERAARTVASLANSRRRELAARVDRQVARMTRYYAQLSAELEEQASKPAARADGAAADAAAVAEARAKFDSRRQAIDREAALRIAELRRKGALQVRVRLLNLLLIQQPKLLVRAALAGPARRVDGLELVWDPLTEAVEAAPCPGCGNPGFAFGVDRQDRVRCRPCLAGAGGAGAGGAAQGFRR
jgi:hypothetical protein